jgi:hypothetical protein
MYIGLFILGNIAFWVASWFDFKKSSNQIAFGTRENDLLWLNRDKYGYFSAKNFWTWHVIYWAVMTAGALGLYFWERDSLDKKLILMFYIMIFYFAYAAAMLFRYFDDVKKQQNNRKKQIEILKILAAQPSYDYYFVVNLMAKYGNWKERNDKTQRIRAVLFPWWYMDGGADIDFQEKFAPRIFDHAKKNEADWFANTELRPL